MLRSAVSRSGIPVQWEAGQPVRKIAGRSSREKPAPSPPGMRVCGRGEQVSPDWASVPPENSVALKKVSAAGAGALKVKRPAGDNSRVERAIGAIMPASPVGRIAPTTRPDRSGRGRSSESLRSSGSLHPVHGRTAPRTCPSVRFAARRKTDATPAGARPFAVTFQRSSRELQSLQSSLSASSSAAVSSDAAASSSGGVAPASADSVAAFTSSTPASGA